MRKSSLRNSNAGGSSVPVFDERGKSVRGGTFAHVLYEGVYGFVAQAADEVRFYIGLASRRGERGEHTLPLGIAGGGKGVGDPGTQGPQGLQQLFALRKRSHAGCTHSGDRYAIPRLKR